MHTSLSLSQLEIFPLLLLTPFTSSSPISSARKLARYRSTQRGHEAATSADAAADPPSKSAGEPFAADPSRRERRQVSWRRSTRWLLLHPGAGERSGADPAWQLLLPPGASERTGTNPSRRLLLPPDTGEQLDVDTHRRLLPPGLPSPPAMLYESFCGINLWMS